MTPDSVLAATLENHEVSISRRAKWCSLFYGTKILLLRGISGLQLLESFRKVRAGCWSAVAGRGRFGFWSKCYSVHGSDTLLFSWRNSSCWDSVSRLPFFKTSSASIFCKRVNSQAYWTLRIVHTLQISFIMSHISNVFSLFYFFLLVCHLTAHGNNITDILCFLCFAWYYFHCYLFVSVIIAVFKRYWYW